MTYNVGDAAILNNSYLDDDGVIVVIYALQKQEYTWDFYYEVKRLSGEPFNLGSKVQNTIVVGDIDLILL